MIIPASQNDYAAGFADGYRQGKKDAERKRGEWEVCNILDYAQRPSGRKILRCPFCGYLTDDFISKADYYHKLTRFCPNCGAYMRGGEGAIN